MRTRTYRLPWPISTNSIWRSVNGRNILSESARNWIEAADLELGLQKRQSVKGPVEISIQLCPPNKRKYDLDNRAKVTIDALVRNGIIEADDNTIVRKLTIEESNNGEPSTAYVTISSVAPLSTDKARSVEG